MNLEPLQRYLAELSPPGRTFFHDLAPATAAAPWIVGSLSAPVPLPGEVSCHGALATWSVTVTAMTAAQARVIAAEAIKAWANAPIALPQISPTVLRHAASTGPYPAGLAEADNDLRFQVVRLDFTALIT